MSTGAIIRLVILGLVFLVWIWLAFGTLRMLYRRGVAASGSGVPGPRTTLTQFWLWFTQPEDKQSRRALGVITLLLLVLSATSSLNAGGD